MRPIDADALKDSLRDSLNKCEEWMNNTDDEIEKTIRRQAYATFMECILRIKEAPTIGEYTVDDSQSKMI